MRGCEGRVTVYTLYDNMDQSNVGMTIRTTVLLKVKNFEHQA